MTASKPLQGLKVYVTHIKDELVPHPSGRTPRQRIMGELRELESEGALGIEFVEVLQGDHIRESFPRAFVITLTAVI